MRSLPRVVSQIPNDLRQFLEKVREYLLDVGDDQFVTKGQLLRGGIIGTTPGGQIIPPEQFAVDTARVPTGLATSGALATIILTWDEPNYRGHARTEIWAADTNDFGAKELVGTAEGTVFSHNVGSGATKYYWIRFVNALDVAGPYNSTTGTVGVTGQDPDYLIEVLSDAYGVTGDAPFFQLNSPTVINGVTIPAGTYIKQAWIADATISRAKIQDLAVDNAKISDLSAAKITAGSLQVGSYVQSSNYVSGSTGWKIAADGSAELSNITARGAIYASSGTIGGATINSTNVSSTNYSAGSAGWRITSTGSAEFNDVTVRGTIDASTVSGSTILSGSASAYMSGAGTYISGSQFRVGDPSGQYVRWTGSALEVSGAVINTNNIQSNQVSLMEYAENGSSIVFSTLSEYNVAVANSVSVASSNTGVFITYSIFFANDLSSGRTIILRVYRDSTAIDTILPRMKPGQDIVITRSYLDKSVSAGSHTYKITAQIDNTTTNLLILAGDGNIAVTVLQR